MTELFEENFKKMAKIIKVLFLSKGWLTKKQLAKHANCSESTLIRYMSEIKLRWGNLLDIQVSKKKGYHIKAVNVSAYLTVINDMAKSSTASKLLHYIIIEPGKSADYYAEKLNISGSTFARKLKQCNHALKQYHLKLYVNQGYHLTGKNERTLRIFSAFFFLEYYGYQSLPFSLDTKQVKKIMAANHCRLNWVNSENTFEQTFFIMYFVIHLIRESQGHHLYRPRKLTNAHSTCTGYHYFKSRLNRLSYKTYHQCVQYFKTDILRWPSKGKRLKIEALIDKNLEKSTFFALLDTNENYRKYAVGLLSSIYLLSILFPFYNETLSYRISFFAEQLKHDNLKLYQMFRQDLQLYSIILNANLSAYFTYYVFWLLTENPEIHQMHSVKKILIISDLSMHHSQALANYVSHLLFVYQIKAKTFAFITDQLGNCILTDFDLIVTNFPISHNSVPSILVNDTLNRIDKEKLLACLQSKSSTDHT